MTSRFALLLLVCALLAACSSASPEQVADDGREGVSAETATLPPPTATATQPATLPPPPTATALPVAETTTAPAEEVATATPAPPPTATPEPEPALEYTITAAGGYAIGFPDAPVTVLDYSDFL